MHIVVHAGPVKTASTTLKRAMERNHAALRRAGIELFAPDVPHGWAEWSLVSLFLGPLVLASSALFPTPEEQRAWSNGIWRNLEAQIDRSTAEVVLISSEHFHAVRDKAGLVARLRRRTDRLSFIAYARDPVSLYVSGIDEVARAGEVFFDLPKPGHFRYPIQQMRDYAPMLGEGDLIVRSFDPGAMAGGDIVADFFHVLSGLAGREVTPEVPVARQNESLCGAATLWLFTANALGPLEGEALGRRIALIEALYGNAALKGLPKLRMTDPEIAKAIRVRNRDTLDWLNTGPLAHSPLETAPPDAEVPPADELDKRMRRWLLSYGREDHMRRVIDAVLRLGGQNPG